MIILDTNVVSEMMKPVSAAVVMKWLDSLFIGDTGITSITVAEIMYGIGALPEGKRKTGLLNSIAEVFEDDFSGRIFPFHSDAAVEYAAVVLDRERVGLPISMADAQIAGICRAGGFTLATRNVRDFEKTGIEVINPWDM